MHDEPVTEVTVVVTEPVTEPVTEIVQVDTTEWERTLQSSISELSLEIRNHHHPEILDRLTVIESRLDSLISQPLIPVEIPIEESPLEEPDAEEVTLVEPTIETPTETPTPKPKKKFMFL